jgi:hypothetical protein
MNATLKLVMNQIRDNRESILSLPKPPSNYDNAQLIALNYLVKDIAKTLYLGKQNTVKDRAIAREFMLGCGLSVEAVNQTLGV